MAPERSSHDVHARFQEKNRGKLHSPLTPDDINRSIGGTKTPLRVQQWLERMQNNAAPSAIVAANLQHLEFEEPNNGRRKSLFTSSKIQRSISSTKTLTHVKQRLKRMRLEQLSEATTMSTTPTRPAPRGVGSTAEAPCPPWNDSRLATGGRADGQPDSRVSQAITIALPVVRKCPSRRPNKSFLLPPAEMPVKIAVRTPIRRTYGTPMRTMLLSHVHDAESQNPAQNDDFAGAESQQLVDERPMEPNTSSFHYPEDSPPLWGSQESRIMEDNPRKELALPATRAPAPLKSQIERLNSARHSSEQWEDDDEEGASGEREEPLDEADIEVLVMTGDDDSTSVASVAASPKRPRTSASRKSAGNAQDRNSESEANSDGDHDQQVAFKKRRTGHRKPNAEAPKVALRKVNGRRSSKLNMADGEVEIEFVSKKGKPKKKNKAKKPKKQPRWLPVDELAVVGKRPYESGLEIASSPPLELSQEPISQRSDASTDDGSGNAQGPSTAWNIKVRPRRGVEGVDASMFRIPKPLHPDQPHLLLQTAFYADGFDGDEAEPIGRLMPIRQKSRRPQSYHKVTIRLKELTIVSERPSETPKKELRRHDQVQNQKLGGLPKRESKPRTANIEPGGDHTLTNVQEEQCKRKHQRLQTPAFSNVLSTYRTPIITTDQNQAPSTPAGNSSPLKEKSQNNPPRGFHVPGQLIRPKPLSQRSSTEHQQDRRVPEGLERTCSHIESKWNTSNANSYSLRPTTARRGEQLDSR